MPIHRKNNAELYIIDLTQPDAAPLLVVHSVCHDPHSHNFTHSALSARSTDWRFQHTDCLPIV